MVVIAGFFTGGALAVRGGVKAARNSAIGCACLLAIIEGVGIGLNRVTAANSMVQNPQVCFLSGSASYHSIPRLHERHANGTLVDRRHRRIRRLERREHQRCRRK